MNLLDIIHNASDRFNRLPIYRASNAAIKELSMGLRPMYLGNETRLLTNHKNTQRARKYVKKSTSHWLRQQAKILGEDIPKHIPYYGYWI